MSSKSEVVKESIQKIKNFRILLKKLIKNKDVSAILIGKMHDNSPTLDFIMAQGQGIVLSENMAYLHSSKSN